MVVTQHGELTEIAANHVEVAAKSVLDNAPTHVHKMVENHAQEVHHDQEIATHSHA